MSAFLGTGKNLRNCPARQLFSGIATDDSGRELPGALFLSQPSPRAAPSAAALPLHDRRQRNTRNLLSSVEQHAIAEALSGFPSELFAGVRSHSNGGPR